MTQSILGAEFSPGEIMKNMSQDERKRYAASMKADADSARAYRDELYARIDYEKYAESVYVPILDETCDVAELKELIAFDKNPAGRKSTKVMAELIVGTLTRGSELTARAAAVVQDEVQKKDRAAYPWKATMADLRALATATEVCVVSKDRVHYRFVSAGADKRFDSHATTIAMLPQDF